MSERLHEQVSKFSRRVRLVAAIRFEDIPDLVEREMGQSSSRSIL